MNTKLASFFGLSFLALASLAGCATDVDSEDSGEPVVATPSMDGVDPQALNTGGTTGCTTSTSCDKDYCCTTETCQFSTFITCTPAPRKTRVVNFYAQ